jgi:uncharacterized protein (DUF1330 family)
MKKGYWVVAYRAISDESAVKAYGALAAPGGQSFGGRFLSRSTSQFQAREAGLKLRTVVVEFDSYHAAVAARESEAYQKALQALGPGAQRDLRGLSGECSRDRAGKWCSSKRFFAVLQALGNFSHRA